MLVAVAVRQVQHAARDEQRGAVGRHVAEPGGELGHRAVAVQHELDARVPEQLDPLLERRRVEAERAAVVGALVDGALAVGAVGAPDAAVEPAQEVGADLEPAAAPVGLLAQRPVAEPQPPLLDVRRRPALLGDPAARPLAAWRAPGVTGSCIQTRRSRLVRRSRCRSPLSHWSHQRRHSWRKPIAGPRLDLVRERVRPRAEQALRPARPARPGAGTPPPSSRPPSRRSRRPGTGSRRSPRTPSPASSSRLGAGGGATRARTARRCRCRSSQASRQPSPATSGSGAIALNDSIDAPHESISSASTAPPR